MPVTDEDVRMLVRLACRLRKETHGCREWDEIGVAKYVAQMKTWNLEVVVEQVLRRGTDPEARTPATLLHKFASPLPSERPKTAPRNPRPREACVHCGGFRGSCGCTRDRMAADYIEPDAPPDLPPPAPALASRLSKILGGA